MQRQRLKVGNGKSKSDANTALTSELSLAS